MANEIQEIAGGATAPAGFRAAAAAAGIKYPDRRDVALLVSDTPAAAAGLFTTNRVKAAPVLLCQARLRAGRAQAVIINSGNANACTGKQGLIDAETTARAAAKTLGLPLQSVLVCSTGTIGVPLPVDKLVRAIPAAAAALSPDGGDAAAKAIMTTDTVDKQFAVRFLIDGKPVVIGGMCKGAGMIEPNMATMLCFLTTDAAVARPALRAALREAVANSFNRISIDGDMSTNDTVILLANGAAGNKPLSPAHPQWKRFRAALGQLTLELARRVVADGEGATKCVTVTVEGARTPADARKTARAICNSLLVKTSWFGGDPNWGRVICAAGYSGARLDPDKVDIAYDGIPAVKGGMKAPAFSLATLEKILKQKTFTLAVSLHQGRSSHTMLTCDCSEEYVKINGSYMT
ncbi:MAG: bifunctional glutamate N-acetyltransferase/amino-acid acetyltransferase ArgJ [Kiritimatiellia bacterium]